MESEKQVQERSTRSSSRSFVETIAVRDVIMSSSGDDSDTEIGDISTGYTVKTNKKKKYTSLARTSFIVCLDCTKYGRAFYPATAKKAEGRQEAGRCQGSQVTEEGQEISFGQETQDRQAEKGKGRQAEEGQDRQAEEGQGRQAKEGCEPATPKMAAKPAAANKPAAAKTKKAAKPKMVTGCSTDV